MPESWARMDPGFRQDANFEHGMSDIAEQEALIAELRRSPLGTVKTQMRAALHKLRRVLKDQ